MPVNRAKATATPNSTATWVASAKAAGATHIWALNETSGTVATDYGTSPSNGAYVNAPTQGVALKNQTGVLLDGVSQIVSLPAAEIPTTSPWSFECYGALAPTTSTQTAYPFFAGHVQLREYFDSSSNYSQISTIVGAEVFANPTGTTFSDGGGFYKDSSDNFYVANATANAIQKTPAGNAAVTTPYIPIVGTVGNTFVFDGSGNAYTWSGTSFYKYPAGNFTTPTFATNVGYNIASVAVDSTSTYVYVGFNDTASNPTHPAGIYRYDASTGALVNIFLNPGGSNPISASGTSIAVIAVDSSNNVFIFDNFGTSTTLKYNFSGTYQTGINSPIAPGKFAIDTAGFVYYINGTTSLYKYTNALAYSNTVAMSSTAAYSIATDSSNNVYVGVQAPGPVYNILKYNSSLALQSTNSLGSSYVPYSLGTDSSGNIYSASNSAVTKFNSSFVVQNYAIPKPNGPYDVKLYSAGVMWYTTASGNLYKVSANGYYTTATGGSGQYRAFALDSTGANVYVLYGGTGGAAPTTVGKVVASTLAVTGSTQTLNTSNFAKCIAMDASNNVYVYFVTSGTIVKYPSTLASVTATYTAVANGIGLALDSSGNMYLSTATALYKYNSSGVLQSTTTYPSVVSAIGINLVLDSTATHVYFLSSFDGSSTGIVKQQIGCSGGSSSPVRRANSGSPRHYLVTYNGTQLTLYVDSVPVYSAAVTINASSNPTVASIGSMPFVTNRNLWAGGIANVAIYPTALTAAQITANYNAL